MSIVFYFRNGGLRRNVRGETSQARGQLVMSLENSTTTSCPIARFNKSDYFVVISAVR
jgi:hypothetical protein